MTEIDRERYEALFDALNPYDDVEREAREAGRELLNALEATETRANVAEEMASIAEDYKAARDAARARLAEVEGENARLREAVTSGQALSQQAAHVAIGASVPAMDIRQSALNLVDAVNAFDAACDAALTEKGTDR